MIRAKKPKFKLTIPKIIVLVLIFIGLICSTQLVSTVEKGTYQIRQLAIIGTMDAKMTPGMWGQWFSDIDPWPKAWTFFFTHDKDTKDDDSRDLSIEVRFQDGSRAKLSGTARVIMPVTKDEAIKLVTERGHKTFADVEQKLILPTVRNVLRSTANLMTARESYNEKRLDYVTWAKDQISNGIYRTKDKVKEIEDLVTGEKIRRSVKVIRTVDGKAGSQPLYQDNPLEGTGIVLKNFEIKVFRYEEKVQAQIAKQQEARMAVETAKARAEQAKQLEQQTVAEGKQKVAKAKYEEEQKKIKAVVEAQKRKEVAELDAQKKLEVAKLEKLAAKETKQKEILLGQGESERKRLVMAADGQLKLKLEALVQMNKDAMDAFARRQVPKNYFASGESDGMGSGYDDEMVRQLKLMNLRLIDGLNLDMDIKGSPQKKQAR